MAKDLSHTHKWHFNKTIDLILSNNIYTRRRIDLNLLLINLILVLTNPAFPKFLERT